MRRIFLICCAFIFALSLAAVYAEDKEGGGLFDEQNFQYQKSPVNKLGRGLINTATCWAEIPGQIAKISKERDPLVGTTMGLLQGTFLALVRGATGIYDMLTCVISPYDKPIMEPEYAVVEADKNFKEYFW